MFEGIRAIIANFASKSYGSESDNFNALTNKLRSDLIDSDVSFAVADKISSKMRDIIKLNQQNYDILSALKQEILTIVGHSSKEIHFRNDKMTVIMLCGTQGVRKTSTCAKLCKQVALEKPNARVAVFSLDFKRSAAQEQLSLLCRQNNIDFISINSLEYKASNISGYAKYLYSIAEKSGYSVLVVDTQGILDTNIFDMQRLCDIKQVVRPDEVLCVIDSTSGQSVIDIVKKFDKTKAYNFKPLPVPDADSMPATAVHNDLPF